MVTVTDVTKFVETSNGNTFRFLEVGCLNTLGQPEKYIVTLSGLYTDGKAIVSSVRVNRANGQWAYLDSNKHSSRFSRVVRMCEKQMKEYELEFKK